MITAVFNEDGILAVLKRYDRMADLNRQLYVKALRDIYPDSRYEGNDPIDIDLRETLVGSFDQLAVVLAGIVKIEGLPYPLPTPQDKANLKLAYEHIMTDAGAELYGKLSDALQDLLVPLAPKEQAPLSSLTDSERNDPNSESGVLTSQQQYAADSVKQPTA